MSEPITATSADIESHKSLVNRMTKLIERLHIRGKPTTIAKDVANTVNRLDPSRRQWDQETPQVFLKFQQWVTDREEEVDPEYYSQLEANEKSNTQVEADEETHSQLKAEEKDYNQHEANDLSHTQLKASQEFHNRLTEHLKDLSTILDSSNDQAKDAVSEMSEVIGLMRPVVGAYTDAEKDELTGLSNTISALKTSGWEQLQDQVEGLKVANEDGGESLTSELKKSYLKEINSLRPGEVPWSDDERLWINTMKEKIGLAQV